jgi:hypothetical protein
MRLILLLACSAASLIGSTAAAASETINYSYDERGRLKQVARSGSVNNGLKACYVLDKAHNRMKLTIVNGTCPP